MPITLNGDTGVTTPGSVVLQGSSSGTVTMTAPAVAGTTTLTLPSTTGTVALTSQLGGMTLLGTITPTAVNSLSLTGLTLTSYKSLYIVFNGISYNSGASVSSNNTTINVNITQPPFTPVYGIALLDLGTGAMNGGSLEENSVAAGGSAGPVTGGSTNVTTSSTAIYFRLASGNWSAGGTITVYGVK